MSVEVCEKKPHPLIYIRRDVLVHAAMWHVGGTREGLTPRAAVLHIVQYSHQVQEAWKALEGTRGEVVFDTEKRLDLCVQHLHQDPKEKEEIQDTAKSKPHSLAL